MLTLITIEQMYEKAESLDWNLCPCKGKLGKQFFIDSTCLTSLAAQHFGSYDCHKLIFHGNR